MSNDIRIKYTVDTEDLKKAQVEFDKLTKEEQDALTALKQFNDKLGDTGEQGVKAGKKIKDGFDGAKKGASGAGEGLGSLMGKLGPLGVAVGAAFSVGAIVNFGKEALAVAGKFQGLEAVLKNTLGSDSAAYGAMIRIQEIASSTPFSVEELTQSFVKLANQGFKPTSQQIIAMGNLASSTGKSFDQLAEAVIDAQVGEFERLKEFGIRANKQGDQVKFTFKGVETTVKNTNEAIRNYVTSLGDATGVSGAMEKQSKTLDGQISNLGDNWTGLLNAIGSGLSPVYEKAIKVTSIFLGKLKELFQSEDQKLKDYEGKSYNKSAEIFVKSSDQALKNAEYNSAAKMDILKKETDDLRVEYGKQQLALAQAQSKQQDDKGSGFARQFQIQADLAKAAYDKAAKLEKANKAVNQAALDEIIKRQDAQKAADAQAAKDAIANAENAAKANREEYSANVKQLEIEKQITAERIKQTVPAKDQPIANKEAEMVANIELQKLSEKFAAKNVQDAKDKAKILPEIIKTQNAEITQSYIDGANADNKAYVDGIVKNQMDKQKVDEDAYKANLADIDRKQKIEGENLKSLGLKDKDEKKKQIENQILFNNQRIEENTRADENAIESAKNANDLLIAENKALNAQLMADDKEAADEKKAIILAGVQLASEVTNQAFQLYQQNLQQEQQALQAKYEEEVRLADGNKQKLTELEEKKAAAEKDIRLRQFKAQQMQSIAQVIFNTAPIIAQYGAAVFTAPLALIALATQAAQIAFILAQPVPEFAEGTKGKRHKGGRAMVGERGVERIVTESGQVYYTPPTATLLDLPKGAQVIPNHLLNQQEINYASMTRSANISNPNQGISGKLTEIGSILKGLPIHQINMDERGFEKYIRTPKRSTKILNSQFPSN